jgi:small subunit ribosomal protein S21
MISVPSVPAREIFLGSGLRFTPDPFRLFRRAAHGNIGWLGGVFSLAEVKLQEGETLENALRRFKRKVQQEDIIKEVKRHSFYLKPGEKRRAKQALARKRNRKKSRREIE